MTTYPTLTVRWWRDPVDRFLSRAEIPRGDNPEIDAEVAGLVDRGGCMAKFDYVRPMEFEQLDPDPIADVKIAMRYPPPKVQPIVCVFGIDDGDLATDDDIVIEKTSK